MKNFFVLASIAIALLIQLGCSSDEEQTQLENPAVIDEASAFSGAPLLGDVVLENMYEDEARQLTDKTPVQIVTVLEGTNRVTIEARFRGVRDFGFGFPLYEFELTDKMVEAMGGIAQGMSGSPVGPPGRIMGALAYGDELSTAPTRFWATAIGAMEAAIDHQTFGDMLAAEHAPAAPAGGVHSMYTPVKTPLMITGLQPHRLQQVAAHLDGPRFRFIELFAAVDGAPAAPPTPTTRLAPGDMIGVAQVKGDVVNAMGFGTVTQVYDDGTFIAFGHPMSGDGKTELPVYRAVTNGIIPNLRASYKSASAYGNPIGKITKDLLPGVVGELGTPPPTIPVKLTYQVDKGSVIEKNHEVSYGQESLMGTVVSGTMEAIRQEETASTVDATVALRFKETTTVYTESFRIASEDVFYETMSKVDQIVSAFTDTVLNSTGQATLAEVSISINDKPQIMQANIHKVIVPEEGAKPGQPLAVSVVLLPHWSAAPGERTIQREVTLEVPADFPVGEARLSVSSQNPFGPPGPFFGFNGGVDEEEQLPENLDELIKKMKDEQIDPSLITITLESLGPPPDAFPPDFLPPESLPFPEDGEAPPEDDEIPGDAEIPPDLLFPEEFPLLDGFPSPPDFEPPPTVEITINLDGFIVVGLKEASITIEGEEMVDGMIPEEIVDGILLEEIGDPVEPVEPAEPAEEE